jgi:hypothetical protein
MAVVQPRAGNVVQPTSDFELLDNGRRLVYHVKAHSKGRIVLGILVAIPLLVVVIFGGFIGLVALSESNTAGGGTTLLIIAALCGAALFALGRWADAKKFGPSHSTTLRYPSTERRICWSTSRRLAVAQAAASWEVDRECRAR